MNYENINNDESTRRLLIVDDEEDFITLLVTILTKRGYTVEYALDAKSAREKMLTYQAKTVLLDIRLGRASGIELLQQLKKEHPNVIFVVMTAYADLETAIGAIKEGAYDYLRKPIEIPDLLATLERCFDKVQLVEDKKKSDLALIQNRATLDSIIRVAPVGISHIKENCFVMVNDQLCEMLGYTRDQLLSQHTKLVYETQSEFDTAEKEILRQIETVGFASIESRWKRKNEDKIDVLLGATPLDRSDFSQGLTMTTLDISNRKQAEMALKESEEKYRNLVERANDGIVIIQDNCIQYANNRLAIMLGTSIEELLHTPITSLIPKEIIKKIQSQMAQKHSQSSTQPLFETRLKRFDGKYIDVEFNSDTIIYKGQSAFFVFVRDITEQLQAREAMQLAERASRLASLGALTAGIAHEINQPLTALKVKVDSLLFWSEQDKEKLKQKLLKNLQFISDEADKIDQIIKHMRSLARQEKIVPQAIDLNQVVRKATSLIEQQLISHTISLQFELLEDMPELLAHETPIQQIIINLINNAMHALDRSNRENKQIVVRTYIDEKMGVLEVRDNGCGIAEEHLDYIFDPFFSTDTGEERMGLGLTITQSLVDMFKGMIHVYNHQLGGAVFTVSLPIARESS